MMPTDFRFPVRQSLQVRRGGGILVALLLVLGGCGGDSSTSTSSPASGGDSASSSTGQSSAGSASATPADDGRLEVGRKLLAEGRISEAMMIFDAVVREHPDLARANFYKGLALHERKLHSSALDWYEAAAQSEQDFPERTTLPYYMAWSYYYSGKPAEAQTQINLFLETTDDRADAHFLAGLVAFNDDDLENAEISFRRALELVQDNPEEEREMARAWIRLSDVLMRQEKLGEALEAAKRATDLRPALSEAWFRQYTILMRLGQDEDAEFARARWKELRAAPVLGSDSEP